MKNIIIIEDDPMFQAYIRRCIALTYFKENPDKWYESSWLKNVEKRLKKADFEIAIFSNSKDVQKKYPKGLPIQTVIVLDGDLTDGSSEQIFHLFSDENKRRTIIHSASFDFPAKALKNGFMHSISKNTDESWRRNLGKKIIELCAI